MGLGVDLWPGRDTPAKMASANCSAVMSPGCRPVYAGRNLVRARLGVRVRVRVRVRVYAGGRTCGRRRGCKEVSGQG